MTHPTADKSYRLPQDVRPTGLRRRDLGGPRAGSASRAASGSALALARAVRRAGAPRGRARASTRCGSRPAVASARRRSGGWCRPARRWSSASRSRCRPARPCWRLSWRGAISAGLRGMYLAGPGLVGHAVRGGGRPAGLPLLRRACLQGALEAGRGGARGAWPVLSNGEARRRGGSRRRAGASPSPRRRRCPPTWWRWWWARVEALPGGHLARRAGADLGHAREAGADRLRPGRRAWRCCRAWRTTSACPTPSGSSTRSGCPSSRPARWRTPASSRIVKWRCCSTRPPPRWPRRSGWPRWSPTSSPTSGSATG